jgi:hypothetical protein
VVEEESVPDPRQREELANEVDGLDSVAIGGGGTGGKEEQKASRGGNRDPIWLPEDA